MGIIGDNFIVHEDHVLVDNLIVEILQANRRYTMSVLNLHPDDATAKLKEWCPGDLIRVIRMENKHCEKAT
jgi:hypothetical protein